MKKLLLFTFSLLMTTMSIAQEIDRTKAPAAGPAPKIQLGEHVTFTLSNGLQVFLVENHKNPRVSWQLFINHDAVTEGENAGMQELMGSLLMTGTTTKTKSEIDETTDFIGGSLSTSSHGAYASSLTKHSETMLSLMSDVILSPTFSNMELAKIKKQTLSGLMANATDPGAISRNVSSVLTYGKDHPYGEVVTKETVESIDSAMCKSFYSSYFKPNISYMIVVGDIKKDDAQELIEQYFGAWEKGDVPTHTYENVAAPEATQVAFIDKPGAVQSTISIVYPLDLKPGTADVMSASVMNAILGSSGFMARLIQNIREDKAYTYGAYSSLSSDPLVGDFYAGAEVRNDVTDSAIVQFIFEMDRLKTEKVSEEELQNVKNYLNGRFARGMESSQMIARFALNTARYNLPADYYATYLERLQAVTPDDVLAAAQKYLKSDQAYIVVVGNKSEVANNLKAFSANGKVNYYDAFGNPVADAEPIPEGITADQVLESYFNAIGTKVILEKIQTQDITMTGSMQGRPLSIHTVSSGNTKYAMTVTSGDMVFQKIIINGKAGNMSGMMGARDLTPEEIENYLGSGTEIVEELSYTSDSMKLIHIENYNNIKSYKMEVTDANGDKTINYYDVKTGLKVATVETQETPQGPMTTTTTFADYQEVNGIKIPFTIIEESMGQAMEYKVEKAAFGGNVSDSNFKL